MQVEISKNDLLVLVEQLEARKNGFEEANPFQVPEIVAEIRKCERLLAVLTTQITGD